MSPSHPDRHMLGDTGTCPSPEREIQRKEGGRLISATLLVKLADPRVIRRGRATDMLREKTGDRSGGGSGGGSDVATAAVVAVVTCQSFPLSNQGSIHKSL